MLLTNRPIIHMPRREPEDSIRIITCLETIGNHVEIAYVTGHFYESCSHQTRSPRLARCPLFLSPVLLQSENCSVRYWLSPAALLHRGLPILMCILLSINLPYVPVHSQAFTCGLIVMPSKAIETRAVVGAQTLSRAQPSAPSREEHQLGLYLTRSPRSGHSGHPVLYRILFKTADILHGFQTYLEAEIPEPQHTD